MSHIYKGLGTPSFPAAIHSRQTNQITPIFNPFWSFSKSKKIFLFASNQPSQHEALSPFRQQHRYPRCINVRYVISFPFPKKSFFVFPLFLLNWLSPRGTLSLQGSPRTARRSNWAVHHHSHQIRAVWFIPNRDDLPKHHHQHKQRGLRRLRRARN